MIDFFNANLEQAATVYVGCKLRGDGVHFPKSSSRIDSLEDINPLLNHLWGCFSNQKELFELSHEVDVNLNSCQCACGKIFEDSTAFIDGVQNLAKVIYDILTNLKREPRVIVAYFSDVVLDGVVTDAIGIYIMKETKALLDYIGDDIISCKGTVVTKAALIFNVKGKINGGYLTACFEDNDTIDWKCEFLNVKLVENEYSLTRHFISLIKNFIENELPKMFDIGAHDKANFLYRTDMYFKEQEDFNIVEFGNEVFVQPEIVEEFCKNMKEECNDAYTLEFKIDAQAYKDKKRTLTSKMTVGDVQLVFKGEPVLEEKQDDKGEFYIIRKRINNI